jgi:hypothetical protein
VELIKILKSDEIQKLTTKNKNNIPNLGDAVLLRDLIIHKPQATAK